MQAGKNREKLSAAYDESGLVCRTHVGGQALIEGIMMRGRYNWALAVRKPNGSLYVEEHDLTSGKDRNSWMYKPVVRGCTALTESVALGYKALEIAANLAFDEEDGEVAPDATTDAPTGVAPDATTDAPTGVAPDATTDAPAGDQGIPIHLTTPNAQAASEVASAEQAPAEQAPAEQAPAEQAVEAVAKKKATNTDSALPKSVMTGAMILGLLLGVAIFVVVPAIITNQTVGDYAENPLLWNGIDGIIRVAIFIGYIFLIGRMRDIKRMFGYHGAEHRTIHCYECGKELTVANAQSYPSLHVRCGTAFMLMTMIIAIMVFTIVPVQFLLNGLGIHNEIIRLIVVIISRIVLLPFIAGLSYEFTVKWAGSHPDNPVVKVVLWPGLQLQRLTTNPPDDDMVECAIAAMSAVLAREQTEAQKAIPAQKQTEAADTLPAQERVEAEKGGGATS